MNSEFFQWFGVHKGSEPDYAITPYIRNYWSCKTATIMIYLIIIKSWVFQSRRREDFKILVTSLIFMSGANALFQANENYFTQFLMLCSMLITQFNFARKANIEISHGLECFIAVNFLAGFFHPIFIWNDITLLFLILDAFILRFSKRFSGKGFLCGILLVTLNVLYFICLLIDLFEPEFKYLIVISCILINAYLFIGYVALESLTSKGHFKED